VQDKIRELPVKELTEEQLDWVTGGAAFVTGTPNGNASNRSLKRLHGQHINMIEHNIQNMIEH
jgi:hypothetical protein